jgi:hypothetical protein
VRSSSGELSDETVVLLENALGDWYEYSDSEGADTAIKIFAEAAGVDIDYDSWLVGLPLLRKSVVAS